MTLNELLGQTSSMGYTGALEMKSLKSEQPSSMA